MRADVSIGPSGRSRGFGTITFSNESEAEAAIDMFNNYEWSGRKIEVLEDWAVSSKAPSAPNENTRGALFEATINSLFLN